MVTQVLSADSHVLEPPDLWTTRMEKRFRDQAPHVVKDFDGRKGDFFVCPPLRPFNPFSLGCAGVDPKDQERLSALGYAACRPGSWDPVERLKDMDADGLQAEIIYCGYGMSMFGHPDDASSATPIALLTTGSPNTPPTTRTASSRSRTSR
jgi:hypothetical protein